MRTFGMTGVTAVVCMAAMAVAQGPAAAPQGAGAAPASGPAAEVQRSYAGLKENVMKAAEKMPASDYSYKPTPEVRTFARVVNHITEAQLRSCGAANHMAPSALAKVPEATAGKSEIVTALKASFAECDKAYGGLTDENLTEVLEVGPAKRSRVGVMWANVSHDNEQYATLALYLRLKGMVPPSSEK